LFVNVTDMYTSPSSYAITSYVIYMFQKMNVLLPHRLTQGKLYTFLDKNVALNASTFPIYYSGTCGNNKINKSGQ
jgi:hypothetical protein